MKTINQNIGKDKFIVAPHILQFKGLDPHFNQKIKRKNYPQKGIYTLRNLMTKEECNQLISKAKELGFQQAGLAIGQDIYRIKEKTRNNKRVIFEDKEMAATLWARMAHLADKKFQNHKVLGLNWRFRVYQYPEGGIFAPHVDERMDLGNGMTTLFTFMIYLNEDMEGGETTFFERRKSGSKKLITNRVIKPRIGMGLAFDHLLFHEGSVVTKGWKYILRSDIVYRK